MIIWVGASGRWGAELSEDTPTGHPGKRERAGLSAQQWASAGEQAERYSDAGRPASLLWAKVRRPEVLCPKALCLYLSPSSATWNFLQLFQNTVCSLWTPSVLCGWK